jgi:hypothetical protein
VILHVLPKFIINLIIYFIVIFFLFCIILHFGYRCVFFLMENLLDFILSGIRKEKF